MAPKHALQFFTDTPFVHSYKHNLKTTGPIYIWYNCSTIILFYFLCRSLMWDTIGDLCLITCVDHSLFFNPIFVHAYTNKLKAIQVFYGCSTYQTTENFLCALVVDERFTWTTMAPNTHQLFSDTTLCAHTTRQIAIWCTATHDNRM